MVSAVQKRNASYNNLEHFQKKYGTEVGLEKYKNTIANRVSNLEVIFFQKLNDIIPIDKNGLQKEIIIENLLLYPDYIDEKQKKIIEIFGDYWHANPLVYQDDFIHPHTKKTAKEIWLDDENRLQQFKSTGYFVCVIWENDILNDYDNCISSAKEFLLN